MARLVTLFISLVFAGWIQAAEIRVFVTEGYAPFESIAENGKPEGFSIDLLHWIAERLELQPVYTHYTFADGLQALSTNQADLLLTVFRNQERTRNLHLTRPYFQVPTVLISRAGSRTIAGLTDVEQRRLGVPSADFANRFLDMQIAQPIRVPVRDAADGLSSLLDGSIDALVADSPAVWHQAVQRRIAQQIVTSEPLYVGHLCFATGPAHAQLADDLDHALATAMSLGVIGMLDQRWLVRPLVEASNSDRNWLHAAGWVTIGLVVIGLLMVLWSYWLRRQIARLEAQLRQRLAAEEIGRQRELGARLLAGTAHDLNHLLTVVSNSADLLTHGGERATLAPRIAAAGRAAGALLRRGLGLASGASARPQPTNLNRLVEDTAALFAALAGSARVTLALDPARPWAAIDPALVQTTLLNLLINARDALPTGGEVTVTVTPRDGRILLIVSDTGSGMPPEVRARLFEPFFTTKGRSGTGLGLLMVRETARAHGGDVSITSAPNAGTTIAIDLPPAPAPAFFHDSAHGPTSARGPSSAPTPVTTTADHVLVIDDDATIRTLISELLIHDGFTITSCANGHQALVEAAKSTPIAAAITDWTMPDPSGVTLIHALRNLRPDLPILICCGHPASELNEALALPNVGYLGKPFNPESLTTTLHQLVTTAHQVHPTPR